MMSWANRNSPLCQFLSKSIQISRKNKQAFSQSEWNSSRQKIFRTILRNRVRKPIPHCPNFKTKGPNMITLSKFKKLSNKMFLKWLTKLIKPQSHQKRSHSPSSPSLKSNRTNNGISRSLLQFKRILSKLRNQATPMNLITLSSNLTKSSSFQFLNNRQQTLIRISQPKISSLMDRLPLTALTPRLKGLGRICSLNRIFQITRDYKHSFNLN